MKKQLTGYAYPFEIYHSTLLDLTSRYWVRTKTGQIPGYSASVLIFPELKFSIIVMMNNMDAFGCALDVTPTLVPAFEQALRELALPPRTPLNLTAYTGVYVASMLLGALTGNITIKSNEEENMLSFFFGLSGALGSLSSPGNKPPLMYNATWEGANTFRLHPHPDQPCMYLEAGFTNVYIFFQTDSSNRVVSVTMPNMDPFYGWTFTRKS